MKGAGNLLVDVDEDQGAELPVLNSIWECPKVNTFIGYDNLMGSHVLGRPVPGATLKMMAPNQNPFGR